MPSCDHCGEVGRAYLFMNRSLCFDCNKDVRTVAHTLKKNTVFHWVKTAWDHWIAAVFDYYDY